MRFLSDASHARTPLPAHAGKAGTRLLTPRLLRVVCCVAPCGALGCGVAWQVEEAEKEPEVELTQV
jgi:hypothetical protein